MLITPTSINIGIQPLFGSRRPIPVDVDELKRFFDLPKTQTETIKLFARVLYYKTDLGDAPVFYDNWAEGLCKLAELPTGAKFANKNIAELSDTEFYRFLRQHRPKISENLAKYLIGLMKKTNSADVITEWLNAISKANRRHFAEKLPTVLGSYCGDLRIVHRPPPTA